MFFNAQQDINSKYLLQKRNGLCPQTHESSILFWRKPWIFVGPSTAGDVWFISQGLGDGVSVTGVETTKLQTGIEDTPPQTWQQSLRPVKGLIFWGDFWTLNDAAETLQKI